MTVGEALQAFIDACSAPHVDHMECGCFGGRTDCCDPCAVLDGAIDAISEYESVYAETLRVPPWLRRDLDKRRDADRERYGDLAR